jgi:gamma-glutamylputrescine oxidase
MAMTALPRSAGRYPRPGESEAYFGGSLDQAGGHLHPLKLALAMARAARDAGAAITRTAAPPRWHWRAPVGASPRRAARCAPGKCSSPPAAAQGWFRQSMPMSCRSTISSPPPRRSGQSAPPRWWRGICGLGLALRGLLFPHHARSRLLFGGGERYSYALPGNIAAFVPPPAAGLPQLADVPIDHAWGGTLSITPHRLPHAAQVAPGLWSLSGFPGSAWSWHPGWAERSARRWPVCPPRAQSGAPPAHAPLSRRHWLRWPTMAAAMTFYALRDRF